MERKSTVSEIRHALENPCDNRCIKILKHAQVRDIAKAQELLDKPKEEKNKEVRK